jgi:hypothetical protein
MIIAPFEILVGNAGISLDFMDRSVAYRLQLTQID